MPAVGEREPELDGDDARAARRRMADDADPHRTSPSRAVSTARGSSTREHALGEEGLAEARADPRAPVGEARLVGAQELGARQVGHRPLRAVEPELRRVARDDGELLGPHVGHVHDERGRGLLVAVVVDQGLGPVRRRARRPRAFPIVAR